MIFHKVPSRFLQDCDECGVDTGDYDWKKRIWSPTKEQFDDITDRAEHYAGNSLDAAPAGLKVAARAFLKSVGRI